MKHNKEPKLSLFLASVNSLEGEEGQGKAEGRDEVNRLLFDWTFAELGTTENTMTGHHGEMDEKKEAKK